MKRYSVGGALLVLALVVAGCVPPTSLSRTVLMDRYNSVRLEAVLDASGKTVSQRFDHPVRLSEDQMRRILSSIQTVEPPYTLSKLVLSAKADAEQAFTTDEVNFLAPPFATAFEKATPDERVSFFLDHKRGFHRGSTSSGVAFVKDGRMHFILGRYRMGKQPAQKDIDVGGNPLPEKNEQKFYLETGPYQELVGAKTAPGSADAVYQNRWVAIDYKELLESPITATDTSPNVSAPAETTLPQTPPKTTSDILEEKLRTLKRLKEQGLITEDDYNRKKQELLRSF